MSLFLILFTAATITIFLVFILVFILVLLFVPVWTQAIVVLKMIEWLYFRLKPEGFESSFDSLWKMLAVNPLSSNETESVESYLLKHRSTGDHNV